MLVVQEAAAAVVAGSREGHIAALNRDILEDHELQHPIQEDEAELQGFQDAVLTELKGIFSQFGDWRSGLLNEAPAGEGARGHLR